MRLDACQFCHKTWEELGIRADPRRKTCSGAECQRKKNNEIRRHGAENDINGLSFAERQQGEFSVPASERGQSNALDESFFCWACHKEHKAKEIAKHLSRTCECGILFVFTLGWRAEKSYIVRVDRHR